MNRFFMECLFKRYILLLVICILPSSIRALNDPASLEAMIANHKKVRTLLEVRAIAELGVYEYHKQSSKKITDHRKVAEQLDKYKRCFDIMDLVLQGTATAFHGVNTYTSIKRNITRYWKLIDTYHDKILSHGAVWSSDTLILNTTNRAVEDIRDEVEEITDFQKQFNSYLDSFGDILSIAAETYGIYYEVDQAFKNIKQLKATSSDCPANLIAVAVSERKNNIYTEVVETGMQVAADIKLLVPLNKDKDKNAKMTVKERIECMSNVRRSLRALNYKMRKMNRLISFTTLMDSWYELRGNPRKTRSMTEIVTACQERWKQKANSVKCNK